MLIIWKNAISFSRIYQDDDLYSGVLQLDEDGEDAEYDYDDNFVVKNTLNNNNDINDGGSTTDQSAINKQTNDRDDVNANEKMNKDDTIIMNNGSVQNIEKDEKLTVVITSYKQPICLERMIALMKNCPIVKEIRVNWFEEEEPKLYGEYRLNHAIPVIFDRYPNKISYRFHPRNFTTEAIFSVDVDTYYSCESISMAFDLWKKNRNAAVGFHARFLRKKGMYAATVSYLAPHFRHNTVFITKGGIVHREKYGQFFGDEYKSLRDKVDEYLTGEDMLMSFILEITKTKVIFTCPQVHNTCNVFCTQNLVRPLGRRTVNKRAELVTMFFDYFGRPNVFRKTFQGPENIVWQLGRPEEECMSNDRKEWENTPPCETFCKNNPICPSNVV